MVTPDVIEDACLSVLRDLHDQHLALLERELGVAARTLEPLQTVDLLIGEGVRLREDKPPVALLGVFGTSEKPERDKDGDLGFLWTLAVQITVVGTDRSDTMRRRGYYAMTIAECLMSRVPRHAEPVDSLTLADMDFTNGHTVVDTRPRTVGEAQLLFDVRVRKTLSTTVLPPTDTDLAPGSPGGPPASDYDVPVPWPDIQSARATTEKESL